MLSADGYPIVYVSGDNASLDVVHRIVERLGPVDVAVLFVGGAQLPYLGEAYLTLPSAAAPEAARILGARHVIPVHFEGWAHFSHGAAELRSAFADAGLGQVLRIPMLGQRMTIASSSTGE